MKRAVCVTLLIGLLIGIAPISVNAAVLDVTQTIRIVSKDLVGERVIIKNTGTVDVNMTGWKLVSVQGNQVFTFPTGFVLKKGASVTITSGEGAYEDWPNVLKWTTAYIWNNDGDSAKLINKDGAVVSTIP